VLNLILWANTSSAAIPFTTFLALLTLWFCVSTPLVFLGAYLGFRQPVKRKFQYKEKQKRFEFSV